MERWLPPVELSRQEQTLMKRLTRVRALFGFLRLHRHELFEGVSGAAGEHAPDHGSR